MIPLRYHAVLVAGGTVIHHEDGVHIGTVETTLAMVFARMAASLAAEARLRYDVLLHDHLMTDGAPFTVTLTVVEARVT